MVLCGPGMRPAEWDLRATKHQGMCFSPCGEACWRPTSRGELYFSIPSFWQETSIRAWAILSRSAQLV